MLPFLFVGAWITMSSALFLPDSLNLNNESVTVILVEYFEANSSHSSLTDIDNYTITDSDNNNYEINHIGIVYRLEDEFGFTDTEFSTLVGLVTDRLPYRKTYKITASNIRNKNGILQPPGISNYYYQPRRPSFALPKVDKGLGNGE